jgi:hypothetical protein
VNVEVTNQPSLIVDAGPGQPTPSGVCVCGLDPDLMFSLGGYMEAGGLLQSILRVAVVARRAPIGDGLPDVFGGHEVLEDGVRFIPHFPFERGVSYRARFDPRPFGRPEFPEVLTLEFSLPRAGRVAAFLNVHFRAHQSSRFSRGAYRHACACQ